jgi:hypothetical protein
LIGTAAANTSPTLAAISNRTIGAGITLNITNSATDIDSPAQTLAYSLPTRPVNASINASNGVIVWRPDVTQANAIYPFSVVVTDNGTPSLSATQNFSVTVTALQQPAISSLSAGVGKLAFQVNGDSGPDYQIQSSTNLTHWIAVFTTNSPPLPFSWTNSDFSSPAKFFRAKAGPPFP